MILGWLFKKLIYWLFASRMINNTILYTIKDNLENLKGIGVPIHIAYDSSRHETIGTIRVSTPDEKTDIDYIVVIDASTDEYYLVRNMIIVWQGLLQNWENRPAKIRRDYLRNYTIIKSFELAALSNWRESEKFVKENYTDILKNFWSCGLTIHYKSNIYLLVE